MLFDRENWPGHAPWAALAGILAAAATVWFALAGWGKPAWPSGASLPGLVFGATGGGIVLFEFLLWPRKKKRTWRVGRAQTWMRAHIWFGLLCLPVLIYHSGLRMGGSLSSVLMILLVVVVVSGIFGAIMQQFLPRRILHEVGSETIYSQIPFVIETLVKECDQLVAATCGPEENAAAESAENGQSEGFITIGAIRIAGRVQGRVVETRPREAPVPNSEILREFFRHSVVPVLRGEPSAPHALATPGRATVVFRELRTKLDPAAHSAVDLLENACSQRRQLDVQKRLTFWLHSWLWVHLPLSIALVVLMFVHVWAALRYW